MQPSSLIFVVVVAIWAAYLVHHWVQRREHLATARSMDRFSEALRVLERRSLLAGSHPSSSRPHSYAVTPAAAHEGPGAVDRSHSLRSPLRARAGVEGRGESASGRSGSGRSGSGGAMPSSARPASSRTTSRVRARRLRGLAFLVTLAAIPATVVLSVVQVLLWVSVAISFAAFVLVLVSLRVSRVRAQAARRTARSRRSPARDGCAPAGREAVRGRHSASGRVGAPRAAESRPAGWQPGLAGSGGGGPTPAAATSAADAPAADAPAADSPPAATSAAEPLEAGWSPVPVPPPTYTLKETAVRQMPEPAAVTQVPVPIEVEDDDLERMAVDHLRRAAGG